MGTGFRALLHMGPTMLSGSVTATSSWFAGGQARECLHRLLFGQPAGLLAAPLKRQTEQLTRQKAQLDFKHDFPEFGQT